MCGIAGYYLLNIFPSIEEKLKKAAAALAHRGPDGEGFFIEGPIGLCHRRLAVIDIEGGAQPMKDPSGQIIVSYNGEIYNFLNLRQELEKQDQKFKTRSDTEVLAALIKRKGIKALPLLRGMFAFAAYDRREKTLLLARDRFGKKPLFWTETPEGFFFASELPALLKLLPKPPAINYKALDLYFTLRYIPDPFTVYKNIYRLHPGGFLIIKNGRIIQKGKFWDPLENIKPHFSKDELEELKYRLKEAVSLRLVADVPVGVLLSGGIDSSLVSALAIQENSNIYSFSLGFENTKISEHSYARIVAERLGTKHEEYLISPEDFKKASKSLIVFGEPFANETALFLFILSGLVRKKVKVVLGGDGGDEIFGGYRRYLKFLKYYNLKKYSLFSLYLTGKKLTLGFERILNPGRRNFSLEKLKEATSFPEIYLSLVSLFSLKEKEKLYHPKGPLYPYLFSSEAQKIFSHVWEKCPSNYPLFKIQMIDVNTYLPGDILFYADHMSMAHGLEVRSPFLDQEVASLGISLPDELKIKKRKTKIILRKILKEFLPENLFDRKKQGFSTPLSKWLGDSFFSKLKEEIFSGPAEIFKILNRETVNEFFTPPLTGEKAKKIFAIYAFCLWLTEFQPEL